MDAFSAYLRPSNMVPDLVELVAYLKQLWVADDLTHQEGGAASHDPSNEKGWFNLARRRLRMRFKCFAKKFR
jgi:hypothetical protein